MPRIPRRSYETCYFHVIVQGYEKQRIFELSQFKKTYLNLLLEEMEHFKVEILTYCIMDNHAHILLYCETIPEMSGYMKNVNSKFANYYNDKMNRVGYVFRDRFLSEPIMNQNYLYSCIAYIHMNPVVAQMVSYPNMYQYSSYNDFINHSGIVSDSVLIKLFESPIRYLELFQFIHFECGIGREYKKDIRKMTFVDAKNTIEKILQESCVSNIKNENYYIRNHFLKLFFELGIGIYQMEKILNIDSKTIKRAIIMTSR